MAAGSSIGTVFRVTTWGESHGTAIGVVADGCPAGLHLTEEDIQKLLDRRKPGQSKFYDPRGRKATRWRILSGVFEGKTTGTPISMIVRNLDQRSKDYSEIASCYRPGTTRTLPLMRSSASGTTGAAAVLRPGKPSAGWRPGPSRRNSCRL